MKEETNISFLWKETKGERGKLLFAVLFSVCSTILTFAPFLFAYQILNELLLENPNYTQIKGWAIWTAVFVLLKFLLLTISGVFSHIAAFNILYKLRVKTIDHLAKLPLGYFTKKASGELKKSINEDIEKIEGSLAHQLPDLSAAIAAPFVIYSYLLFVDWKLSLVLLVPLLLSYILQALMFKNFNQNMNSYHTHLERMNAAFVEYIRGMFVFKAFNITGASFEKLRVAIEGYQKMWVEISRKQSPYYALFSLVTESSLLFVIPIGGLMMVNGAIEASAFLLFLVLSITFLSSLKQLLDFGGNVAVILEGVSRLKHIWAETPQRVGKIEIEKDKVESLSFRNVSFKYENHYVLRNVSLYVAKGETIAFVGPSGAGKTTAGELAARFFDLEEGCIQINNASIQDIRQENVMDLISFVFQDTFLAEDTIWNNIVMGRTYTKEQVEQVCKDAEIHEFITSLPNGYETRLGENGVKVSGGQKQRIAIARAMLKDSPIVILDEATSHSDIENERKIQRALNRLLVNKMTIIIAHRLHTIAEADRIYAFKEGYIVEEGDHLSLMKRKGLYENMWRSYKKFEEEVV
ncbi:ABC transporter permease [Bacillus manliponensis]|uniref:ABC transporter permease n=1 Tax=Bacillus manliponensis TaxID=574376 RepID=A0A073JSH6_9BACI|nr:ABC transporter ATP-binding protein [Bacillus manliponensis]KEK18019.1 ABC transporter permease [Bacillus manliponensis]